MTKTTKPDQLSESDTQIYFVPGHGEIEATDLEDVNRQIAKLKKQEDGDGNR